MINFDNFFFMIIVLIIINMSYILTLMIMIL